MDKLLSFHIKTLRNIKCLPLNGGKWQLKSGYEKFLCLRCIRFSGHLSNGNGNTNHMAINGFNRKNCSVTNKNNNENGTAKQPTAAPRFATGSGRVDVCCWRRGPTGGLNATWQRVLALWRSYFSISFSRYYIHCHSSVQSRSPDNHCQNSSTEMSDEAAKAQTARPDDPQETIFGKILKGEIPTKFIYEDELVVAFDDISPVAPVHFLIIPRKTITMHSKTTDEDEKILGRMMCVARKLAEEKGIDKKGYRLVMNNGRHGCQSVYHLHLHVIGGRQLGWPPC